MVDVPEGWAEAALHACIERLRTGRLTSTEEIEIESAWTDGRSAFCVVYRNPYFAGLIGVRRDATDALFAIASNDWNHNMMTDGHDMADREVIAGGPPDPVGFGWNVADFDIGEPHAPTTGYRVDGRGVHWHGHLAAESLPQAPEPPREV
jgi:hypothetical protein